MPDLIGHLPFTKAFKKWRVSTRHFCMNGDSRSVAGMTIIRGNDIFAKVAKLKIQKRTVGIATGGSLIAGWWSLYKFCFCGLCSSTLPQGFKWR